MKKQTAGPLVIFLLALLLVLNGLLAFAWLTGLIPRSYAGQKASEETEASSAAITAVPAYETDDRVREEVPAPEPVLALADPLPALAQEDLEDLAAALADREALTALDADGTDLSDLVAWTLETAPEDPGQIHALFTLDTPEGEHLETEAAFHVDLTHPLLLLKEKEIELEAGDALPDFRDMILVCRDLDGTDLRDAAAIGGDYVQSLPGTYTVTYRIYSRVRDAMSEAALVITVR